MGILTKAVNQQSFLKAGIFGDPGSGKTTTASYLAMAISHKLGNKKPIAFFETEAGSDFLVERFDAEKIELLRVKSHSLADLMEAVKEAEQSCSVLIVDSITHVWNELVEAKLKATNRAREAKAKRENRTYYPLEKLEFQHWADVKREWGRWTTLFLNSKLHVIVCGRAGGIWETEKNEETNKREIQKVGTKMKAEADFGYEPSLLIEMVRVPKGNEAGSGWQHRAHVLKDRTDTINGLAFSFEKSRSGYKAGDWQRTFKPFDPVIAHLNLGGEHLTVDATRTSEKLFPGQDGESQGEYLRQRAVIAVEELEGSMVALWPGRDAASNAMKGAVIEALFGTRSWTAVQHKKLSELEAAVRVMKKIEAQIKSLDTPLNTVEELKRIVDMSKEPETVTQ